MTILHTTRTVTGYQGALCFRLINPRAASDKHQGYVTSTGERINCEDARIDPSLFFEQYICKRRPVSLKGLLPDAEGEQLSKLASLAYLRSAAQSSMVKIEPYNNSTNSFGTALTRKTIAFPEFLDLLQDPSQRGKWYLTTQYNESDSDEDESDDEERKPTRDPIFPPPSDQLVRDIPRQPSLMGNLVLQQCNFWIGNSLDGTSSGLHHDFHDNLYILLRGYKRFVLFPPSSYAYLHIRGQLKELSANGLLHYGNGNKPNDQYENGDVKAIDMEKEIKHRADGLTPLDAARWLVLSRLRRVREIEATLAASAQTKPLKKGKKSNMKDSPDLADAHERLEQARKTVEFLKMYHHSKDELSSGEEHEEEEGNIPLFGNGTTDGESDWDAASAFDEAEALLAGLEDEYVGDKMRSGNQVDPISAPTPLQTPKPEPLSFSRITPAALHEYLGLTQATSVSPKKRVVKERKDRKNGKFGDDQLVPLPGCPPALVVDLRPGEMLYLPAGWFHEVTSTADVSTSDNANVPVHVALNYWFHPPDQPSPTQPYKDGEVWSEISCAVAHDWDLLLASALSLSHASTPAQKNATKDTRSKFKNGIVNPIIASGSQKHSKKRKLDATPKIEAETPTIGETSEQLSKKARRNPRSRRRHLRWLAANALTS